MKLGNGGQGIMALLGALLIGLGIVNAGTSVVIHSIIGTAVLFILGVILLIVKELYSAGYTAGKVGLSDKAQAWIVFISFIFIAVGGISIPAGFGNEYGLDLILMVLGALGLAFKEWATGNITINDLGLTDNQQGFVVMLSSILVGIGGVMSAGNVGGNPFFGFIVAVIGAIGMAIKEFIGTYQPQPQPQKS